MAYVARAPGRLRARERKRNLERVKQEVSGRKAGESHPEWNPWNPTSGAAIGGNASEAPFSLLLSAVLLATYRCLSVFFFLFFFKMRFEGTVLAVAHPGVGKPFDRWSTMGSKIPAG